jgi:hypothetical protein
MAQWQPNQLPVIMDVQQTDNILVEEGAAGDGFFARWPPHLLPDASGFFSTLQGRRALSPLSSGIFASAFGSNHELIDGLHTSVRQLLNRNRYDWVLISVFGVAIGSQEPQPTLVIVLRPGGASAAGAKFLVKQVVEVQQQYVLFTFSFSRPLTVILPNSLGIDPAFAVEIVPGNQDYRQIDELAAATFPNLPRLGASVGPTSSAKYGALGF